MKSTSSTPRLKQMSGLSIACEDKFARIRLILNLIQIMPRHALGILKPEYVFHSTRLPVFQVL